jgi:hypothetical protein
MNDFKINKRLNRVNTLPLKTAVIIADEKTYNSSKKEDFTMYYIHGVIVYDIPYKEKYLLFEKLDFNKSGENDSIWVSRDNILTLKQIRMINKDNKEGVFNKKRLAILAELESLKGGKL